MTEQEQLHVKVYRFPRTYLNKDRLALRPITLTTFANGSEVRVEVNGEPKETFAVRPLLSRFIKLATREPGYERRVRRAIRKAEKIYSKAA